MKSFASLFALTLAVPAVAGQEPPPGEGPRGSSQEVRYDAVGYAAVGSGTGVSAVTAAIEAGGFAEVTAIDTGRTIVVTVEPGEAVPDRVAALSPDAVAALGATGGKIAVRIRKVTVSPQDVALLRAGSPASRRADAPPVLLAALRRKLGALPIAAVPAPAPRPAPAGPAPVRPAPGAAGFYVQVAALSDRARAAALAASVGGFVASSSAPYRVRIGPFADRARADAAARGRPGAHVLRLP